MSTPTRRKAVFDPNALDDDLDDLWPARPAKPRDEPAPEPAAETEAPPKSPPQPPAEAVSEPRTRTAPRRPSVPSPGTRQSVRDAEPAGRPPSKRHRPPEALLSAEVYDELYRVQNAEKKVRRGLARTMGAIVLDAIEAHAHRLQTTWTVPQTTIAEGQLFERPSATAVPPRRRHLTAPRTVVLSGVTAGNAERLDDLVQRWGAGTRSALVEQALRYEFGLLPEPQ
ncbi:hypothetical protein BTO20_38825 (plasmid) [Mycobacterium dioxanotrophicus]|jgi:hypothetical protein|uniref:Uncharacterized protein n=2 Tax=Mycobacteriaceae TaxID=1762 RepID=A0A1Y0CHT5_9MYCO|nr:hypothetical protein [Mycobacterium dioxanotrophicus]ART74547.1 hypothetical protein BTO20_38825 [Mycobacterium dioxanotrophicus]GAY15833.1 hypothetical protein MSZK_25590 [Mycobacterium sp. shizuoka-1]